MSDIAIKVEGLGKKYRIGRRKSGDLRESFGNFIRKFRSNQQISGSSKQPNNEFWALRDVSFEISQGEAVGIIGRNGAGKSTLLKILSRITEPTTGRIEINGRVSSLLEVGTGFHPELTGRENIYLNGTILGMKRKEVKAKFDEIVDFSGVEKFIDMPIKHYSSGMKVRLAFSVAAHLEPELLLIDEVLAVGDSVFQKKCLDKMSEVTKSGITILFVSHNMQAVRNLCSRAILLQSGICAEVDITESVINKYLNNNIQTGLKEIDLENVIRSKWARGIIFKSLKLDKFRIKPGDDIKFRISLKDDGLEYKDLLFGINIHDNIGNCVIHLSNIFKNQIRIDHEKDNVYEFDVKNLNLKPGRYTINLFLRANEDIQDWLDSVGIIEIEEGNIYGFENSKMITGLIQPEFEFMVN